MPSSQLSASLRTLLFLYFLIITTCRSQSCRDRTQWPFSSSSIWNMPIGSKAQFHTVDIFSGSGNHPLPNNFFGDTDYWFQVYPDSPYVEWYNEGFWGPNQPYCEIVGPLQGSIRFPSNTVVGNNTFGNNNAAAILQTDNITLLQMQPLYICNANKGPLFAMNWCMKEQNVSILSDGIFGCHGGSKLSSIGGTIRKGELTDDVAVTDNIRHALKLEFFANQYYYGGYEYPCYRWPASDCDNYHHDNSSGLVYNGTDAWFTPGALLAVPTDVQLDLQTVPGKKILFALQNYGGYLCDDTATNRGTLCIEDGVADEFESKYGYAFNAKKGDVFYDDLLKIFQQLKIVINNNATSVGGGGNPLQPLAPPICGA